MFTNPISAVQQASLCTPAPIKGSRVLYIFVCHKLRPITKLRNGEDLFNVWHRCILCHLTLWKEWVYHGDVSPGNMMWYGKDRKRIGVLNDWDLSSLADEPGPGGNERTGTVLFMALDILTAKARRGEVKNLYRHGLESFIWVFAWISLRYKMGVLPRGSPRPIDAWASLDAVACGEKKHSFIYHLEDFRPSHMKSFIWRFLVACFHVLDTGAFTRRQRRVESLDDSYEQIDDEKSISGMDDLLGKFTGTKTWIKLSNPPPS